MTRGIWRYLEKLPPIDWALIAHEHRTRRPSRKQIAEWTAKAQKARKRNLEARRRIAAQRSYRRWIAWKRKFKNLNLSARMLGAMQPGEWYGRPDIRDLSGVSRDCVHGWLRTLERRGLVRRERNPDFVPVVYRKGLGIHLQAKGRAPEWLFTLTPDGEAERFRLLILL